MIKMLAAIFHNISTTADLAAKERDHAWSMACSEILSNIADALRSGVPPENIAEICEGASEALVDPSQADEIYKRLEKTLSQKPIY